VDTWRVDWELSPDQVATLERAYGERDEDFVTHGVGVLETAGGYVVVAGNGTDGFAVRGVDGEWERVGFVGMDCCTWLKTADFDTVDQLPPVHAYPVGFLMGIGLSTLALPFLAAALRWRRGSQFHIGASIAGGVAYVVGAFLGVLVLVMNSSYGTMTRGEPGLDMLVFIPLGGMAMAVVVVALASWGLLRRGAVLATLGGWFAGTLVAGFTASVAEVAGVRSAWLQAGAGVIALAALYAVYVPLMRRWTTWSRARGVATGAPEWTRLDAMVLGGIGPGKTPTPVPQVVYQAGFSAGEYPSREQLELSLGRLAASRLVKISDFVWFRTTREGQALVRRASRGGTSENLPDALLSALRGVPCKEGRVRISQE